MRNKEIKSYFTNHPDVPAFHFTADGQCFFNENEAQHNAWAIKDNKITTITADEAALLEDEAETNLATVVEVVEEVADFTQVEKIVVTQAILDLNPWMVDKGIAIGDELDAEYAGEADENGNVLPVKIEVPFVAPAVTAIPKKTAPAKKVTPAKKAAPKATDPKATAPEATAPEQ